MGSDATYERFVEWLNESWWKMPPSEHRLPMIRAHYTVEQAVFLTGFPHRPTTAEELAEAKGTTVADLLPTLAALARKGMLYESTRDGETRYRISDPMLAMMRANLWPQAPEHPDWLAEVSPHVNRYYLDNWADQWEAGHVKGLRTIPIEKTIQDPRKILPYEDIVKLVGGFTYFTVSNCPCRVRHRLDPDHVDCERPLEVCLHFDELGRYIVKHGMGREISKAETHEILKKAADSGLVHAISTPQEKPDTICNCCGCCCLMLEPFHKLGHVESLRKSNYRAEIDASSCTACGLCERRCPVDAIRLKTSAHASNRWGKTAVVEEEACIGCGVCAHKCPSECIGLEVIPSPLEPPKTGRDWVQELRAYQEKRL